MKSKKKNIIWSIVYMALVFAIVGCSIFVFTTNYYETIFVSGQSMAPTLNGGSSGGVTDGDTVDFGKIDKSNAAKNNIQLFDIVTTYYHFFKIPSGEEEDPIDATDYYYYRKQGKSVLKDSASYKIKRVVAKGPCYFEIKNSVILIDCEENFVPEYSSEEQATIYFEKGIKKTLPFTRKFDDKALEDFNLPRYEILSNQYFVMGDHWSNSLDSYYYSRLYSSVQVVSNSNITGVLQGIYGTATVYEFYQCPKCKTSYNKNEHKKYELCSNCKKSTIVSAYNIKDKRYTFPSKR